MIHRSSIASAMAVAVALTGCAAHYHDVSSEPDVRSLKGTICTTQVPLVEHGVVAYGDTKKDGISLFSLTPEPGFGGREVLSRRIIPAGRRLKVLSVQKCNNCLYSGAERLSLQVQLDDTTSLHPMYLPGWFGGTEVIRDGAEGYVLNRDICQ